MPRKPKDIRRKGRKLEAYVRVNGTLRRKMFERDHPREEIRKWIAAQKLDQRRRRSTGSLTADVERFLAKPEIAAQPYVHQTTRYLAFWTAALGGDRHRFDITRDEIEDIIQRLLTRYAEPTVYHYRSALLSLYTGLDGAGAANPVKETTCPRSWIPKDHSVAFDTLTQIVAAMPAHRHPKKGIRQPSIAKLVGDVIVNVGIRPADLLKVRAHDIDAAACALRWPESDKGQGTAARWVPLTPNGLKALLALAAADGLGRFNPEAVSHSFKRAARAVDGKATRIHLYAGRHSLGADLYREVRDLATVGRMLNHAPGSRATAQYAQGANADVDRAAVAALTAARQERLNTVQLPKKLPTARKRQKTGALRKHS